MCLLSVGRRAEGILRAMRRALLGFVFLVICASSTVTVWTILEIRNPYCGYPGSQVFVDISHGASRHEIARQLAAAGVLPHWLPFELYSRWHSARALEAGEYLFDQAMEPRDVFWKIAEGHVYVRIVVVPEGWTMFDIAAALDRAGICSKSDFLAAADDPSLIHDLAPDATTLEGYLFPATYEFTRRETARDVAAAMVSRFRSEWALLAPASATDGASVPRDGAASSGVATAQARAMRGATSVEAIATMASLVERETPQPQERPLVASVFYNRLALGYPLQCDPTVQYALELAGRPAEKVTSQDLEFDSPYNTYLHRGLPPGPIANPGEAALRAALAPAQTDYLYFVADAQGGHLFSSTLAQHNRNVTLYRRRLAGDVEAQPEAQSSRRRKRRGNG